MRRVTELELERYRLDELPPRRAAALRERLAVDPELAARLRALDEDDAALLDRYPPRQQAAVIEARRAPRARRRAWLAPAGAVALLLLAALLFRPPTEPVDRPKGDAVQLFVDLDAGGERQPVRPGQPLSQHDVLQLQYRLAEPGYGVVLSLDGRGLVTWHLPRRPGPAEELLAGETVDLPASYTLDDAPGFERFVLVFSVEPFDGGVAARALQAAAAGPAPADVGLGLPAGFQVTSFEVGKEPL